LYSARSNDAVREFIEFAKSPQGQAIVRQNGFFDLSAAQCAGTGSRQRGLHGANQLSRVFRFRSNRATLDAQATDALDVVASTLRDLFDFSKVEIIVAGYADSTGTEDNDLILSKQRAETVKNELVKRNVEVTQILHFGHASPVALNDTEEGRALNRRVEVWIRRR
jgi:outer membrane protein OmpA-like peptidoglycan-associated protein